MKKTNYQPHELRPGEAPIPGYTHEALINWIHHAHPPGGFLTATLSNDLRGAVLSADENNRPAIPTIVRWLYNRAPAPCWGSPERLAQWRSEGGLSTADAPSVQTLHEHESDPDR